MVTSKQQEFLRLAIRLAEENVAAGCGGPFGAVIVKDEKIVAAAANTVTTSNDPTAHAEVNAIREACKKLNTFDLSGCEIYSSCEPCPMCLSAIYWARIKTLYYAADKHDAANIGFDDSFIYDELAKPENKRELVMQKLDLPEGLNPFNQWAESANKVEY